MAEKDKSWSVNSGKWAYSQTSPTQSELPAATGKRRTGFIVAIVSLIGIGMAASAWFGFLQIPDLSTRTSGPGVEPNSRTENPSEADNPSLETSRLEEENSKLKLQIEEQQKTIDEKQQIIDRQEQALQRAAPTAILTEYSIIKQIGVTSNSRQVVLYADHNFVAGQDHWVSALCYFSPVVNGVKYWVELARRDPPDWVPKARLANPETLTRVNLSWPEIFSLASNCPWMDGAHYSPDELSSLSLAERQDPPQSTPAPVPTLPAPGSDQPEPTRSSRQVFYARDLVGTDLKRLSDVDQTECEALCMNNRSCQGYTYDNWNRMCITKSDFSRFRIEPRSTAVIFSGQVPSLSDSIPVMTKRNDRAFNDSSYKFNLAANYDICADMCLRDDRCLGVNFSQNSSRCQFFASPSEYKPKSGTTLGYKSQPPD